MVDGSTFRDDLVVQNNSITTTIINDDLMYDNCSTSTATRRDAINSTSQQRSYRRRKFGNIARPDSPKCKVNFGNFDDHDDDDDGGGDDVNAVIDW